MSEEKRKPVLDEQTLGKLLEAAYVLQEHNRELRQLELDSDLKRDQVEAQAKADATPAQTPPAKPDAQLRAQADYTFTLAQIVATQHQIQIRNLELDKAIALVAERLVEMTHADGAGIGIVDGKKVKYRAVAGGRALPLGTEVNSEKALCLPVIRNGQVFRCPDVNPEFLVDTEECHRRGIQSLVAVPIFHEGGVAGGVELYYSVQSGFTDQDVHTCQLMAGLVTEALARDEEVTWKKSLASERAVMLDALEKLKPNLTALVDPSKPKSASAANNPGPATEFSAIPYLCSNCGHNLVGGESFCGQCGTPRAGVTKSPSIAPVPSATQLAGPMPANPLFHAEDRASGNVEAGESEESLPESIEEEFPDLFAVPETTAQKQFETQAPVAATVPVSQETVTPVNSLKTSELSLHLNEEMESSLADGMLENTLEKTAPELAGDEQADAEVEEEKEKKEPEAENALATQKTPGNWTSAASAREYLEQLAGLQQRSALARFWDTHRGDVYLAVAVLLVACVIRWGIWSNRPVSATTPNNASATAPAPKKADPQADLSPFDRLLISLGLAEAPETPEDKGNPSTRVWVDLHTALYYCPGSDAYGKTPKGKFMTQRDAELDSYEPASRKACN